VFISSICHANVRRCGLIVVLVFAKCTRKAFSAETQLHSAIGEFDRVATRVNLTADKRPLNHLSLSRLRGQ